MYQKVFSLFEGWLMCQSALLQSILWACIGFLLTACANFTFHTVFLQRALRCLFITPTPTGNFSGSHLLCPDPFSQPCSFSKPVILPWVGLIAGSDPLWRKVIPWPSQLASPTLFLVPASQWSLLGITGNFFGVRQSPAFIFWQLLFKQRHCAVGDTSKRCNKHCLYYELWSMGYQNRI